MKAGRPVNRGSREDPEDDPLPEWAKDGEWMIGASGEENVGEDATAYIPDKGPGRNYQENIQSEPAIGSRALRLALCAGLAVVVFL